MNLPFGYKSSNDKIVTDEYQSKIMAYGLNEEEIKNLLDEFKVPKTYEREINFDSLKKQMIQLAEKWRQENI